MYGIGENQEVLNPGPQNRKQMHFDILVMDRQFFI
jgi:hypothetical protein